MQVQVTEAQLFEIIGRLQVENKALKEEIARLLQRLTQEKEADVG